MVTGGVWGSRGYGLLVTNSVASVPSFAPVGREPLDYHRHLGGDGSAAAAPPLVEVLAHHRDRWGHVERFDEFVDLVEMDPDTAWAWAEVATTAGMDLSMVTSRDRDGWCWWAADTADRCAPIDVVSGHARSCRDRGLAFGTWYASAGPPTAGETAELLERHRHDVLVRTAAGGGLVAEIRARGPGAGPVPVLREMPAAVTAEPWILLTGLGRGLGFNRAEDPEDAMTPDEIVALLTEARAKRGALLVAVGVDAQGRMPSSHVASLTAAGDWVRSYAPLLDDAAPWLHWGDATTRYLRTPTGLAAIDLTRDGHLTGLTPATVVVSSVTEPTTGRAVPFEQGPDGVTVEPSAPPSGPGPLVWELTIARPEHPAALFRESDSGERSIDGLDEARSGAVLRLSDGVYSAPSGIPRGVAIRGLGADRTTLQVHGEPIEVARRARLEHLTVRGSHPGDTVVVLDGEEATVLGCAVSGVVSVTADDVVVRGSSVAAVTAKGADRLSVSHCEFPASPSAFAVHLQGGGGQRVESCEFRGVLGAVLAEDSTGTEIRGNDIEGRRWGVYLRHTEDAAVHANRISGPTRAVDVEGGANAHVDANAVYGGDSGCVVRSGAADCEVSGNRWEGCRIGSLQWAATSLRAHDNTAIGIREADEVAGP